ncbi:MAG: diguanylate cyclase [Gammaproteobacteria bacterium]
MRIVPGSRLLPGSLAALSTTRALWLRPLLTGLTYYLGARLGINASIMSEGIAIFWPSNGFLLAALLLSQPRHWLFYALAVIPAEIAADLPAFTLQQALLFAAINIFETLFAASLLKVSIGLPVKLDCLRHVALFGLFALLLASGTAGLLGAAVYSATADDAVSFTTNWRIWWFGDSLGLLLITPLLLGWMQEQSHVWGTAPEQRRPEALLLSGITIILGTWIFSLPEYLTARYPASPILMLPLSIWAAARFGIRGAASINLAIAVVSILATIEHRGPFISLQQADNVLKLQEYLVALAFSSLTLAALLQALRMQNSRLRALSRAIETVHAGILITDAKADNRIIYANQGFEEITGYTVDEVLGKNPRFLQDPSADPTDVQAFREAIRQRQGIQVTLRNRRKDGSIFYNQMIIDPVCDETGNISHFIGVQHDISTLIEKESALLAVQKQLEDINRDLERRIEQRTCELKQANEKLEKLAATDPLTGAYNRRHFMTVAGEEFERALRYREQLTIIAIDIDFFKRINDRCGHAAGDKVLIKLTEIAHQTLRPSDIFARFGGEEFFILLPKTGIDEAMHVAERLRSIIALQRIEHSQAEKIGFCVSMGVALLSNCDAHAEQLLKRADQALYAAKKSGRNCIRISKNIHRIGGLHPTP